MNVHFDTSQIQAGKFRTSHVPCNHVMKLCRKNTIKMNPYEDYKEKINLANQFILTFDKPLRFKKSCNRQSVLPHTSSERQI